MAIGAATSTVKSSGTAVAMTNEACSVVTAGSVYQITSATRRVVDPFQAVTVRDNGTLIAANLYRLDYTQGRVTFSGYTATGPVTITGAYLPLQAILEVKSYTISAKTNSLDSSTFDGVGWAQRISGLNSVTGSISFLSLLTADLDSAAVGTQSLSEYLANGTPKLVEIRFGSSTSYFRGWVLLSDIEEKADVNGVVEGTANFESAPQMGVAAVSFT